MPGAQAHAEPTVAEIEAQINKIWGEAEPLIEKYNDVHEQFQKKRAMQAALQKKIEPLQRQVDLGQLRIGVMAAAVYKDGQADPFNAVLTAGSSEVLAEQLALLDQLARNQQRQLQGVSDMKAQYDAPESAAGPTRG